MQREIDMIVRQLLLKSFLFKCISKLFHVTKDIRKSRLKNLMDIIFSFMFSTAYKYEAGS